MSGWARDWFPLLVEKRAEDGSVVLDSRGEVVRVPLKDPESGALVRFEVACVPDGKIREVWKRHYGSRQTLRIKGDAREQDLVPETDVAFQAEYGSLAWTGAEHAEWCASDAAAAERLTKALGFPVRAGDDFSIDGEIRREGREEILLDSGLLRAFVIECADRMRALGRERRESAGKDSPTGSAIS